MTKLATKPLAWAKNGTPLEVSDDAVAWQVKRLAGTSGGRPSVVYGEDGAPLILDLDATLEDLKAAAGPGRYRLNQIDEEFAEAGPEAIVVIQEASERTSKVAGGEGVDPVREALAAQQKMMDGLLATVRAQQQAMTKALEAQTQQLSAVMTSSAKVLDVHNGQGITELVDGLPERLRNAAQIGEVSEETGDAIAKLLNGPLGMMLMKMATSFGQQVAEKAVPVPKPVGDGNTG